MKFPIKKRNPDNQGLQTTGGNAIIGGAGPAPEPPPIPPYRTFVIRKANGVDAKGKLLFIERIIDNVHSFEIGEGMMVAFPVFFHFQGQIMTTVRRLVVLSPGDEVEEIHAAFGEPVKH